MHRSLKGKLVIGLVALAVAAFAGAAYAATQNAGTNSRQAFLNDVAKRLHVTPQQLSSALNGAYLDQLQGAVKSGRLTQAQANALQQRLKRKGTVPVVPFGPFGLGPRAIPGPRMFGPGFGPGPSFRAGPGLGLAAGPSAVSAAAGYLGLNDAQLFQQLASGKSLAQIAASKGKTVGGLESAVTTAVRTRLDKLVAAKVITATQEQKFLSRLSARLADAVNQKGLGAGRAWHLPHGQFKNGAAPPIPPGAPGSLPVPAVPPASA